MRRPPQEITRASLERILELMHRLAAPGDLDRLLQEIMQVGRDAIVAEEGILWLLDPPGGDLLQPVAGGEGEHARRISDGGDGGDGWAAYCARTRAIANVSECRQDRRYLTDPLSRKDYEVRALLNVPVLGRDRELLGVMQWLGREPGQFDEHDEWVGPTLAAQAAVAIQHARMAEELVANAVLHREVAVAREIQQSTLPDTMPRVPGYDLHGHFQPTDQTGGDLFDLVVIDGRLFLLLGDATGHGFGPALSATQMQAMLRVAFRLGADLEDAYRQVNNQMAEDLPDDRFITAFMGFLDTERHALLFHSAGQGPILHYRAEQRRIERHAPTSFPLGVLELDRLKSPARLELAPGDILAVISDGVFDHANREGARFGERRVGELLHRHRDESMESLCQHLLTRAFEFGGDAPQADDITLLLVKREL